MEPIRLLFIFKGETIMSKKEKVLNFVKKHKVTIAYFTGAAIGVLGMAISYHHTFKDAKCIVTDQQITDLLLSAGSKHEKACVFTWAKEIPFGAVDLGKIGEEAKDMIGDHTFTHILAIGKSKT
jgi:hypothetical protein